MSERKSPPGSDQASGPIVSGRSIRKGRRRYLGTVLLALTVVTISAGTILAILSGLAIAGVMPRIPSGLLFVSIALIVFGVGLAHLWERVFWEPLAHILDELS